MPKMNPSEALRLGGRINKALRPFKQATEVLATAIAAEANRDALAQEYDKLTGIVKRLTKTISGLEASCVVREEELRALAACTAGEQETLDAAKKTTAEGLGVLRAQEEEARVSFAKVMGGLQGHADEAAARLADLHVEEERIDVKLAQFKALAGGNHE